ncbi:conserved hypothetical protein [Ricinus communis]|uniref:Beta-galactosidase galactose-binding domain-containing protein n=1 Tax=Ricinus communis TaxID=3988 RepID=B9RR69_RICCO|nr:conserved hypothetical protein [Ricinus communis]
MGKGFAWVNGNNIGRYWPSFLAENGFNTEACRGNEMELEVPEVDRDCLTVEVHTITTNVSPIVGSQRKDGEGAFYF